VFEDCLLLILYVISIRTQTSLSTTLTEKKDQCTYDVKTKTCARFEVLRALFLKIPSLLGCDSVLLGEWFPEVSEERIAMRGHSHWTD